MPTPAIDATNSNNTNESSQWTTWSFYIMVLLLTFAPIFRGGNRPLALMIIHILALVLAMLLLWNPQRLRQLPLPIALLSGIALLGVALTLIPLPPALWLSLSGHELYAEALQLVNGNDQPWRPLSIMPFRTELAWFRLFTYITVFCVTYSLPVTQLQRLIYLVVGIAVFQAALGLIQWGGGSNSIFRFGNLYYPVDAIGTYANRDHLAGFLAMISPLILGLLAVELGQKQNLTSRGRSRRSHRRSRSRSKTTATGMSFVAFFASIKGQRAVVMGMVSILILLGIVFTRSRAGIGLAMLGLLISMVAFAWRLGGRNVYGTMGSVVAILVVLATEIGLMPVLDRFSADPMQDGRWDIFSSTLNGIGAFFPLGSGAGTFPQVYPAFQPIKLGSMFINHAHNDFLEAIFEQGLLACVLILLALAMYIIRWKHVWLGSGSIWSRFRFIQVAAGIGICILLLHSLVDFNLQIPANAIFFAFFIGIFFKEYDDSNIVTEARRRIYSHERSSKSHDKKSIKNKENTASRSDEAAKLEAFRRSWSDFGDADNPFKD